MKHIKQNWAIVTLQSGIPLDQDMKIEENDSKDPNPEIEKATILKTTPIMIRT
jgi:hypothetical protein